MLLTCEFSHARAQDARLVVHDDAAHSELIFDYGPVNLPAAMPDMADMAMVMVDPPALSVPIPISGYVHGFTVDLLDQKGKLLPSTLLHHINFIVPQRRELFSPIMQRLGAAGAETGPLQFPRVIGYPVERGDSLLFSLMLSNETDTDYGPVTVRVHMRYSTGNPILPTIAVQPFYMDVMPPAGVHAYTLPAGKSAKSWEGSPAVPGRILALGGHLHKYGTLLRFEDVTAGKVLWEAKPVTDTTGEVVAMPRKYFLWRLGLEIRPDHVYRVTAEYDNPTGKAIEDGAMGTLACLYRTIARTGPRSTAAIRSTSRM